MKTIALGIATGLIIFCLWQALAGTLALSRSADAFPSDKTSSKLEKILASVDDWDGSRFIVEIPPDIPLITLPDDKMPINDLLRELARQTDCELIADKDLFLFRPDFIPGEHAHETKYRMNMAAFADALDKLEPILDGAFAREEWVDVKTLPPLVQETLRKVIVNAPSTKEDWESWVSAKEWLVAVGFLFDPYVEIITPGDVKSPMFFFRTRNRLPRFNTLVPSKTGLSFLPGK